MVGLDDFKEKRFPAELTKYDCVDAIKFSHDTKKVFSTSKNELFIWDINAKNK